MEKFITMAMLFFLVLATPVLAWNDDDEGDWGIDYYESMVKNYANGTELSGEIAAAAQKVLAESDDLAIRFWAWVIKVENQERKNRGAAQFARWGLLLSRAGVHVDEIKKAGERLAQWGGMKTTMAKK